jgi:hypothetical protein
MPEAGVLFMLSVKISATYKESRTHRKVHQLI